MKKDSKLQILTEEQLTYPTLNKWNKIFAHSLLFGIQAILFSMPNAIFKTIFTDLKIITVDQEDQIPKLVGIMAASFFIGKTFSDPLWGVVRDHYGDKASITMITISLLAATILFALSSTFFMLNISVGFVGLSCGICTPGYSFMNWIDPKSRPILSMIINLFNGAGGLTGPIVGSFLVSFYKGEKRVLKSWLTMSVFVAISTVYFFASFKDFNDKLLIADKEVLEEIKSEEKELDNLEKYNKEEKETREGSISSNDTDLRDLDEKIEENNDVIGALDESRNEISNIHRTTLNLSRADVMKANEAMNETKVGYAKDPSEKKGVLALFCEKQFLRDLINGQSVFWAIKVLDWLLIPIWASIAVKDSGLGFSNIMVGEITFYSFPGVFLILVVGYGNLNVKQEDWLIISFYVFFFFVAFTPFISIFSLSMRANLWILVFCECIKVSCYLIYTSAWSVLMNELIDSSILGRMYSFSFCFSHLALIFLLQAFPRLLTFVISSPGMKKIFGKLNVFCVFFIMALPSIWGIQIGYRIKRAVLNKDDEEKKTGDLITEDFRKEIQEVEEDEEDDDDFGENL